jgi:endonuclease III
VLTFSKMMSRLKQQYGQPEAPPAEGPFALVMWENACYLLPDERRREVFEALQQQVGMNAAAIDRAPDSTLLPLAQRGGMRPEVRVFRWREIARITLQQFDGDLDTILEKPYPEAKRALKQFPNIGDPGAEKILLFCGMMGSGLPLESNGLRVLVRVGWARPQKNYASMYRDVQQNIAAVLPRKAPALQEAFLLLREHGQATCKDKLPRCGQCPLANGCDYAAQTAARFLSLAPASSPGKTLSSPTSLSHPAKPA